MDGHALAAGRSLPRNDHGREIYILIKCTTVSKLLTWIENESERGDGVDGYMDVLAIDRDASRPLRRNVVVGEFNIHHVLSYYC
jgi:hypothetical protein